MASVSLLLLLLTADFDYAFLISYLSSVVVQNTDKRRCDSSQVLQVSLHFDDFLLYDMSHDQSQRVLMRMLSNPVELRRQELLYR